MDFYYDPILGLVYSFSQNMIALNLSAIPRTSPLDLLKLYQTRGIIMKHPPDPDGLKSYYIAHITSNIFDCDWYDHLGFNHEDFYPDGCEFDAVLNNWE